MDLLSVTALTITEQSECLNQDSDNSNSNGKLRDDDSVQYISSDSFSTQNCKKKALTYRTDYLSWEEYFMASAYLASQRSKDPTRQVGAVIVNKENKIVGSGYNGMPIGCSDDVMPWGKASSNPLENKHLYVCHAEMNAILNKINESVKGCTIYTVLFPCNECAKLIIQSGIREVIYARDENEKVQYIAAKNLFNIARIKFRRFVPKGKIVIDFSL